MWKTGKPMNSFNSADLTNELQVFVIRQWQVVTQLLGKVVKWCNAIRNDNGLEGFKSCVFGV